MAHYLLYIILFSVICLTVNATCQQETNCFAPKCYCSSHSFPNMDVKDIPQMVYFGFDDAVNIVVSKYYDRIFNYIHYNPNGCPITMSLYVSHHYTDYNLVEKYYQDGHEIGVHSVDHNIVNTSELILNQTLQQKYNLINLANVKHEDIVGWRSPFLVPAGDAQPTTLKKLGFKYDITLTYPNLNNVIWPSTLDFRWPYNCNVPPCPTNTVKGFWEVPVISLNDKAKIYKCAYADSCALQPNNVNEIIDYLWDNFQIYYNSSRAPFGLNMHAAWFTYKENERVFAMNMFLDKILALGNVYVVSVKQVLEWMENPTPLSNIKTFKPWSCAP